MNDDKNVEVNFKQNSNILNLISYNLKIIKQILQKTKHKERTKKSSFFFTFVKKFAEQGVQGIVGVVILKKILKNGLNLSKQDLDKCSSGGSTILSKYFENIDNMNIIPKHHLLTHEVIPVPELNQDPNNVKNYFETGFPLVFKLSVDMSNMITHEQNVAEHIFTLQSYCPHFINILGNINIPISSYFILVSSDEDDLEELYNNDSDYEDSDDEDSDDEDSDGNSDNSNSDEDDNDDNSDDSSNEDTDSENSDEEIDEELKKKFELELKKANNLFYETKEAFPRNILLFEKIHNFPFHRLLKKFNYDNNIISSQLLQILLGLQIAQNECKFTHYDLHTSNILEQHCELDSVFLYNIKGEKYMVPTYGYYPKIIDLGSSYSENVTNHTMMTHANSYDYGFQSQFFDPLNDVHHSFLSLFYYIENKKSCFETLCNKIKYMFHNVPVLRKSGWKKLPHDLTDTILYKIKKDCLPEYEDYDVFRDYKGNFLEIFNSLISIPFEKNLDSDILDIDISKLDMKQFEENKDEKNSSDNDDDYERYLINEKEEYMFEFLNKYTQLNFKPYFHNVMVEINKMFHNEETCGEEILFILRELFHIINNNKAELIKLKKIYESKHEELKKYEDEHKFEIGYNKNRKESFTYSKMKKDFEQHSKNLDKVYNKIKHELKEKTEYYIETYIEFDIDYKKLVNGLLDSAYIVQSIYYILTKNHKDIIDKCYQKTIPKQPVDIFKYISRNFTPSFDITPETIVYYWDIDNKKFSKHNNFWSSDYKYINILPFNKKADALYKIITK